MSIKELLEKKNMTKYRLSKESGVPHTTINDIFSGKAKIEKCSAETLYKLSKVFGVSMEVLIEDRMKETEPGEYRSSFETFKSNICHLVHDIGDIDFIIGTLESDKIRKYYNMKWYPESLYLLAMVDYLCRENDLPICSDYNDLRAATKSEQWKADSLHAAIPEFRRFNIVESEVRNVR